MDYFLTRLIFQKALAAVYLIAFLIAFFQFKPLLGSQGLMPVALFVKKARFKDFPSLFFLFPKDICFTLGSSLGIILAIVALTGLSEIQGLFFSGAVWFVLWALYLSFVNVGQLFYAFGWEILLLETGFLAVFLGSSDTEPPFLIIWLLRLVLFRMMLGAGLIKLRFDKAWKDLTSMVYHYETQPLPGPFSIYFHRLPLLVHKSAALFNHFVELIVPFALLLPAPFCIGASLITAFFQGLLILSGNLSWLNYITLVLCISCFNDTFLESFIPFERPQNIAELSLPHHIIIYFVTIIILVLNIRPLRNLLSQNQMMNASFDPLHLVNTYGAFGTVTKVRKEIIIEGTDESEITENTLWKPYEFKAKPSALDRRPPQISPYNHKLDWQIWFAAMNTYHYSPWMLKFVQKLLEGDQAVTGLLRRNPFEKGPPHFIRCQLYDYHFTDASAQRKGVYWRRDFVGVFLPSLSLNDPLFK